MALADAADLPARPGARGDPGRVRSRSCTSSISRPRRSAGRARLRNATSTSACSGTCATRRTRSGPPTPSATCRPPRACACSTSARPTTRAGPEDGARRDGPQPALPLARRGAGLARAARVRQDPPDGAELRHGRRRQRDLGGRRRRACRSSPPRSTARSACWGRTIRATTRPRTRRLLARAAAARREPIRISWPELAEHGAARRHLFTPERETAEWQAVLEALGLSRRRSDWFRAAAPIETRSPWLVGRQLQSRRASPKNFRSPPRHRRLRCGRPNDEDPT